jgi:hypothetical protein
VKFVVRHDVRRTDDYWFEIDEYRHGEDQLLLVHLQFFKWTPAVCRRVLREFKIFRTHCRAPLFACAEKPDAKWFKFITMMGYRFHQNIECNDGSVRPLFIHIIGK